MFLENIRHTVSDVRAFLFYDPAKQKPYLRPYRNFYFIRRKEPYILVIMESFEDLTIFSELLGKNNEAIIFKFLPWSHESLEAVKRVRYFYNEHKSLYPKHQVHILCNTEEEQRLMSQITPFAYFANQNAFLDERLFPAGPGGPRQFDVIYNGRLIWMKRQHLLSALNGRIALFGDTSSKIEWDYVKLLKRTIPLARMLHFDHAPYLKDVPLYEKIEYSPYKVLAGRLNRASTGAILSRAEGANYASAEYLLSGLPVVSTPSVGGRSIFFDKRYCRITAPDPLQVKNAVEELIALKIDPAFIREETLKKMKPHRTQFQEILYGLCKKLGIEIDEKNYWNSVFENKMLVFGNKFPESFEAILDKD